MKELVKTRIMKDAIQERLIIARLRREINADRERSQGSLSDRSCNDEQQSETLDRDKTTRS